MGTQSMGASRTREVDSELNKEGVVEVREVVKRIEQFNHNHLGWITGVKHQIKNSKRKTNGTHFGGLFNPFHREFRVSIKSAFRPGLCVNHSTDGIILTCCLKSNI